MTSTSLLHVFPDTDGRATVVVEHTTHPVGNVGCVSAGRFSARTSHHVFVERRLKQNSMHETDNPDHHEVFSSLQHALPMKYVVVGSAPLRTLTLMCSESQKQPVVEAQARFSADEWACLLLLLRAYPAYVKYEQFESVVQDGSRSQSQLSPPRARRSPRQLRKVRRIMCRMRSKLSSFPLTISALVEIGYVVGVSDALSQEQIDEEHRTSARQKFTQKS